MNQPAHSTFPHAHSLDFFPFPQHFKLVLDQISNWFWTFAFVLPSVHNTLYHDLGISLNVNFSKRLPTATHLKFSLASHVTKSLYPTRWSVFITALTAIFSISYSSIFTCLLSVSLPLLILHQNVSLRRMAVHLCLPYSLIFPVHETILGMWWVVNHCLLN